jgi:hypothetical protein
MKKSIIALTAHSLLTLLVTCCLALAEDTPQLQKLKHTILSPSTEQVALQLNGSYSPKAFTLKDESPRIIFDFADMTYSREVKNIATNGSIVKRVRVGMHTDDSPKTRVVFDLSSLKGVTYTQKFDEKTSTLIVQFTGPAKSPEQRKPQPEPAVEKEGEARSAPKVEPIKKTGEPPKTDTHLPQSLAIKQDQPPTPAASSQKEPSPVEVSQPAAPTTEAPPAAKPEPPKPIEKIAAAPPKAAEEKLQPPPQAQAKSETKQPAQAETKQAAGDVKPAEPVKETAVPPPTEEQKKVAAKEPKQPEPTTKPDTVRPDEASKKDASPPSLPVKTAEEAQLESVKFDATSPKGEMVVFKLNGFHPPAVHGVEEGVPRVICDFNNTKLVGSTKNLIKTDGKFVKVIRTSKTKKPEKVRVVIDLEPNRSYDLQQVFFKEDNLFVLIVNSVKK